MSLFQEACKYIPGGVNSPVRAFRGVGGAPVFFKKAPGGAPCRFPPARGERGEPFFFKKASGAYVAAADGRRFIDYVGSWGPMILGHAHPRVVEAVRGGAADG